MAKIFKHRTDVQIETRKKTGLTESKQRQLSRAIKRARHLALLPFVANG
jgi:ribosomal protein S18